MPWLEGVLAVFLKDWRSEFRTRYALNAALLFAVTTLVVVSFAIGAFGISGDLLAAFLWVVILFSSMAGLGQVFIKEVESRTFTTLRLVARPSEVWTGKFFFNLVLLLGLEVIIIPLFFILLNPRVSDWGGFLAILILGSIGLAGATTLIAAIIAQAKGKGALLAGLSYPILIPLLAAATSGTRHLFRGVGGAGQESQILAAYAVVVITAGSLLFEFIWNE